MDPVLIIGLILIGIGLIIAEILIIPGTTFVGFLGAAIAGVGVVGAYYAWGTVTGHILLLSIVGICILLVYLSFKLKLWNKLSLNDSISDRASDDITVGIQVGDEGVAISDVRPSGDAEINNKKTEVTSEGGMFIPSGTSVKVVRLSLNKVFVLPS